MQKKPTNRTGKEAAPKPLFSQSSLEVILPEPLLEFDDSHAARPTIVLRADYIGAGDPGLGTRLLLEFLEELESHPEPPQAMLFYSTAVNLVLDGSVALATLRNLAGLGCEMLACQTSLRTLAPTSQPVVGRAAPMAELVDRMRQARLLLWP